MTAPYWEDDAVTLHLGDCLDVLRTLPDASVDAVVTDPPYELAFMGRAWDASGIAFNPAVWAECLRVLKPGGHLLAFGGTRTYHRLAVAIEDSGFDIRDSIGSASALVAWCYGSGFPKSRNISEDPSFCQCVPPMRGAAAEEAAESAAHLLLADLRRNGQAIGADIADLHGLSVDLHPDYSIPGRAQQDVRPGVCGDSHISKQEGSPLAERPEGQGPVCPVRDDRDEVAKQAQAQRPNILFAQLPGASERGDAACECIRCDGDNAHTPLRSGQPGLEGRGDLQASEGQLHRPQVCPVSARSDDDGPIGRLHHGAPSRDGSLDRTPAVAHGSRESHRPESTQQRQGEPGTLSVERGPQARRGWPVCGGCSKPALPAGLGTALKPAWEPIVVARKPLAGTVAANVLEHGTGALNIDACRTAAGQDYRDKCASVVGLDSNRNGDAYGDWRGARADSAHQAGRWPTNVVLSHQPLVVDGEVVGDACASGCVDGCPVAELDQQSGIGKTNRPGSRGGNRNLAYGMGQQDNLPYYADEGGASRFFPTFRYEAKAPASERPKLPDGTAWPTVKPVALMRWLVRLVTPPNGVVLDPFAGTGTTAEAAVTEGFRALLIERDPQAAELIKTRLAKPIAPVLDFEGEIA